MGEYIAEYATAVQSCIRPCAHLCMHVRKQLVRVMPRGWHLLLHCLVVSASKHCFLHMDRPTKSLRTSGTSAKAKMSRADAATQIQMLRQKVPHCSAAALAAIADLVHNDMPPINRRIDRRLVRDGRNSICFQETPYGSIHREVKVELNKGILYGIELQDPFAMLFQVCRVSSSFSSMIKHALHEHPNSLAAPWGLIIYSDKVIPGNQLKTVNSSKTQSLLLEYMGIWSACVE